MAETEILEGSVLLCDGCDKLLMARVGYRDRSGAVLWTQVPTTPSVIGKVDRDSGQAFDDRALCVSCWSSEDGYAARENARAEGVVTCHQARRVVKVGV